MNRQDPIIIIGMHRSGTMLVTQLLQKHGLFIGDDKEKNWESRFFLRINDWLLRQSISSWDKPYDFDVVLNKKEYRELAVFFMKRFLTLPRVSGYMGLFSYLRYGTPSKLPYSWGWKDPRNTITLPIWLDIFPHARVLCVERNGLDVALSLIKRRHKDFNWVIKRKTLLSIYHSFFPKKYPVGGLLFIDNLASCVSLWKYYLLKGRSYGDLLGDRFMTVQFENLLKHPHQNLSNILKFCGLDSCGNTLPRDIKIDPTRCFAYKGEIDISVLSPSVKKDLEIY